jgi:hypothetical protein
VSPLVLCVSYKQASYMLARRRTSFLPLSFLIMNAVADKPHSCAVGSACFIIDVGVISSASFIDSQVLLAVLYVSWTTTPVANHKAA